MKTLAGRPQDEQDIQGLLAVQGDNLDWDYCITTAEQLGEAIEVDLAALIRTYRESR